jgi:hypothetical protein
MREDDDIRHYMPVLRRLIILVAVIIAIPVVMWTITAMVRTYVGPPKLPTFRPMAAAPATAGPDQAAAAPVADENGKAARQPVVDANATSSDTVTGSTADNAAATNASAAPAAGAPTPAAPGSFQTANLQPANAPAASGSGTGLTQFAPEERQAATNWPSPPATNWPSPQQSAAGPAADAQPIDGPVPLPRKRPHTFAIAQSQGIPLPRPRPDTAGPVASDQQQATPVNWLRNIFGSQGQQPAAASPPTEDEYRPEPH